MYARQKDLPALCELVEIEGKSTSFLTNSVPARHISISFI